MIKRLIVSIHGILTKQTAQAWQEMFKLYVATHYVDGEGNSRAVTLEKQYWAGTFPIFNVLVKNHLLAAQLADEIIPYLENGFAVSFVCHSNGADICVKTMKILARLGHRVNAAVFIAGAINPDVTRNGIGTLVESGMLGRAVAYCSGEDMPLGRIPMMFLWPYGRLGCVGFIGRAVGRHGGKIINHWFNGYDHCDYFTPINAQKTFHAALLDCTS